MRILLFSLLMAAFYPAFAANPTDDATQLNRSFNLTSGSNAMATEPPPEPPKGSMCGIYMMSQSSLNGYMDCKGHNPRYSCPTGYKRATLGYFEAGGGDRNISMCVKR